jgi:PPOX class probable F420-dependent enzyme
MAALIDESSDFGARVARHLRDEVVVWFTTVTPAGAPLPAPVWFIWDGAETVSMYSMDGARVRNLEGNPRVTLNFGGDGGGGDIVVLSGRAAVDEAIGPASGVAPYVEKYGWGFDRIGVTPEEFSERYPVPVRIELTRLRA